MNNDFKKTIYRITLEGNEELLSWTISHYMQSIVSTYIKLTTISNIISFVNNGIKLQDFIICKSPIIIILSPFTITISVIFS